MYTVSHTTSVYSEQVINTSIYEMEEGVRANGVIPNNIRYADDIVVLTETEDQL